MPVEFGNDLGPRMFVDQRKFFVSDSGVMKGVQRENGIVRTESTDPYRLWQEVAACFGGPVFDDQPRV